MSRVARYITPASALALLFVCATATGNAQAMHGLPREGRGGDVKPNTRVGRPAAGQKEYKRFCAG